MIEEYEGWVYVWHERLDDYEVAVDALERLLLFTGHSADHFSTVQEARAALARLRGDNPIDDDGKVGP